VEQHYLVNGSVAVHFEGDEGVTSAGGLLVSRRRQRTLKLPLPVMLSTLPSDVSASRDRGGAFQSRPKRRAISLK
jgi:hypothetical protein